jgi:hypothetical protein
LESAPVVCRSIAVFGREKVESWGGVVEIEEVKNKKIFGSETKKSANFIH